MTNRSAIKMVMDTNKAPNISKIYGFPLFSNRESDLLEILSFKLRDEAKKGKTLVIFTPNPEMVVKTTQNKEFLQALLHSDYNIPDGVGLTYLSKLAYMLGVIPSHLRVNERITGADMAWKMVEKINQSGGKVFLLGASSSSNIKAQLKLSKSFPKLLVSGEPGYINIPLDNEVETQRICALINKFEPDLLLVAFGQVKQELWLDKNKSNLNSKIAIGVGGTFDYWSGEKKRVPSIIGYAGFEWLWRLCIEPKRLGRIINAVLVFPFIGMRLIFQNRG
jgi:N-acetylglucosaminyldiphosphoundecaprenol N-acetyl-beta-D-mannosaminyltransferase